MQRDLFTNFFIDSFKHAWKLFFDPLYRETQILFLRYGRVSRFTRIEIRTSQGTFMVGDARSFLFSFREIFLDEIYKFKCESAEPLILDGGANIGLSIIYFRKIFPNSSILAFEPDPEIFRLLKKNLESNNILGVDLRNEAIWTEDKELSFCSDGADGGRVEASSPLKVSGVDIKRVIGDKRFAFLKLDIEGAESAVIPHLKSKLEQFHKIFLEYHSRIGMKQNVGEVLSVLNDAGFRLRIETLDANGKNYDLQMNIFADQESESRTKS